MSDTELRYLEGTGALKESMHALSGREPNAEKLAFASSCLLHGRMFWEAAERASLETRPLLLYYGAAAFAKALVLACTAKRHQDLKQAHGVSCSIGDGDLIENFRMRAQRTQGLFHEFNDVVAPLNRLEYSGNEGKQQVSKPNATSEDLANFEATIDDCLARALDIESAYELSTGQKQRVTHFAFMQDLAYPGGYIIGMNFATPLITREAVREWVTTMRRDVPFLANWALRGVWSTDGRSTVEFNNIEPPVNEFDQLQENQHHFGPANLRGAERFDPLPTLPPFAGSYGNRSKVAYVEPVDGHFINEHTLTLACLLGLSSLVRYHPHVWTACVHRRPIGQRPVDDRLLPVIEAFLGRVRVDFPEYIATILLRR
jgi:hypothetical protein